jgi:hypothetical protein
MDFFNVYNIVQIASSDISGSSQLPNVSIPLQQIVLKPAQSAKKKIKHFRLLTLLDQKTSNPIIEQYLANPFADPTLNK